LIDCEWGYTLQQQTVLGLGLLGAGSKEKEKEAEGEWRMQCVFVLVFALSQQSSPPTSPYLSLVGGWLE